MGVIWYKVWFDLWHNKARTLLVVLSIAAGVFAIGAMFGMADLMLSTMDAAHRAVIPAHIRMSLGNFIDRDTALSLKNIPGVEGAQPLNEVAVRYKLHPEDPWKQGIVYMLDDFEDQSYELIQLKDGRWPKKDDIGIERMAAQFLNLKVGDQVIFKVGNNERALPISGRIRHPFVPPPQFMDLAFFFMDADGLERFDIPAGKFDSLLVRVTPYSEEHAREIATEIKDRLGKEGISVGGTAYEDPNKHWGRSFMDAFTVVLQVLAVVSLFMSVILVYNTLSALISQQTNQIGIIKAVGGRSGTIVKVYLGTVLVYGLLALVISVPLGALLAFGITRTFLNLFNIDYNEFTISTTALTLQILAAVGVPLLASAVPVLQGAGITVREAIASYGLGGDFGSSRIDRAVEGLGERFLPSQYATSLAGLFRRKGRLAMTQLVLITAGIMFLMVMSLNSSIRTTLDRIYSQQRYDVQIQFTENQRIDRVADMAQTVPGVDKAELRFTHSATVFVGGEHVKEAGIGTTLHGIPDGSDFYKPFMLAGRWLEPGDGRVVVITKDTADKSHVRVGDTLTMDLGELGKDDWQVIGIYDPVFAGGFNPDLIYAPRDAVFEATKVNNKGGTLYVRTTAHDDKSVDAVTAELKELYEGRSMKVSISLTEHENKTTNDFQFGIVTNFMLALAIMVAVVGGIALAGALSISVVERTKEIGVLRAIGARSRTIMAMFVMEGVLQGLLSWLIAVPIAFLTAKPMSDALGRVMFNAVLDYAFNLQAVGIWLVIILVISTIASVLPARNATRVSVRDSLAYA